MTLARCRIPVFAALLALACLGPDEAETYDLVFEGNLTGSQELLVRDRTGDVRRWLAAGTTVMDPAPSPDGARIAFVVSDFIQGTGDIFLMDRDGTNVMQLTNDPEVDDQPAWSPDGTRIAFRSFRTQLDGDIWVMNADGSGQTNLTPDPVPAVIDMRRPAWSPDGTRIAYASNEGGTTDIWTMRPDGTNRVQITNTQDLDVEPAWSPDGGTIVFRRSYFANNLSDLVLIPSTGGTESVLLREGHERLPAWQPDGARIVFVAHATPSGRPDLHDMKSDGTDVRPLVTDAVAGGSLNPAFLKRR